MRVNIDEIKEGGLRKEWDLPREALDAMVSGDRAGYRAGAALHVEAELTRTERRVFLSMRAKPALSCACGRCLTPMSVDVPVDFELTLVPEDEYEVEPRPPRDDGKGAIGGSFQPDGADEEFYRGREIDLDPILREEIVLAMPAYPVCKESCKGLCTVCGANLNERDCGCERRVPDPRLAGLAKFKKQSPKHE